ncbi:26337_t:CDS:2, partial [Racocetra persica]
WKIDQSDCSKVSRLAAQKCLGIPIFALVPKKEYRLALVPKKGIPISFGSKKEIPISF